MGWTSHTFCLLNEPVIVYPATRGFSSQVKANSLLPSFISTNVPSWFIASFSLPRCGYGPGFPFLVPLPVFPCKHTLNTLFSLDSRPTGFNLDSHTSHSEGQEGIPHYLLLWWRRSRLTGRFVWWEVNDTPEVRVETSVTIHTHTHIHRGAQETSRLIKRIIRNIYIYRLCTLWYWFSITADKVQNSRTLLQSAVVCVSLLALDSAAAWVDKERDVPSHPWGLPR